MAMVDVDGSCHSFWRTLPITISVNCVAGFSGAGQEFLLSDPEDKSLLGRGSHKGTIVNTCLNSTYRFVETVINQLISLHKVTLYYQLEYI